MITRYVMLQLLEPLYVLNVGVQPSRYEGVGGITPGDTDGQCADNEVVFTTEMGGEESIVEEPLISNSLRPIYGETYLDTKFCLYILVETSSEGGQSILQGTKSLPYHSLIYSHQVLVPEVLQHE
ncbi:hypothetical protein M0R45_035575 [Rubus argutus]|uniref:Uncharacterized protein n=1 Tax=Rubus argutus TaxID=59490 RepID=A0AAW1VYY7_RUBAR